MEPSDWIAFAAIVGTVLVGIFSPFLLAVANGRKEKAARVEERRDEAYTKLALVLREEKEGLLQSWLSDDFPHGGVLIPNPEEVSWVEARVSLVGSKKIRTKVQNIREELDRLIDEDSTFRELLTAADGLGIDPDSDPDISAQRDKVRALASSSFAAITDLEGQMRNEIAGKR